MKQSFLITKDNDLKQNSYGWKITHMKGNSYIYQMFLSLPL